MLMKRVFQAPRLVEETSLTELTLQQCVSNCEVIT
jgi:hypothetical protein